MSMSNETQITIHVKEKDESPVMAFAASELRRCLSKLDWGARAESASIELLASPQPEAHPFDDGIFIDVKKGKGVIQGDNPRSVLIAVYRYLKEIGCRFPFPGVEEFPEENLAAKMDVFVKEQPEYRYRGLCIEGANSIEMICEVLDFLPKLGLNCYFIQFRQAYAFFNRWYQGVENPYRDGAEPLPVEQAEEFVKKAAQEISKRGLIYHAVGHGWTCDPFGVPGLEWIEWKDEIPEETLSCFASVGGKRGLADGIPLNTSLCMSKEKVRQTVVASVLEYAQDNPSVDIIHVWLSDGMNSQCECDECVKKSPSDWYVVLLNEIDEMLSQHGCDAKIVFLIYTDLLWPPTLETIKNPERFIMMFAPISRTYRKGFEEHGAGEMSPFVLNKLVSPKTTADNLAYLRGWQGMFSGDSFDFDYHYMWAHVKDAGDVTIARILHEDIRKLKNFGLNGFISCQVQRAMMPSALGIIAMAEALWGDSSFDEIRREYFSKLYGKLGETVYEQLRDISTLCHALDLEEPEIGSAEKAEACAKLSALALSYEDAMSGTDFPSSIAYDNLKFYYRLWSKLALALESMFLGDKDKTASRWGDAKEFLWKNEDRFAKYIDCYNFSRTFEQQVLGNR